MSKTIDALSVLHRVGALLTGHFVGTSGKHLQHYVNKDAVYPHTEETSALCLAIAQEFSSDKDNVEVVIGPEKGAIILSQWTAYHLTMISGLETLSVYAEKAPDGDGFVIKRSYDKLVTGKNVLVVEDVLTTGGSAKKVIEAVRAIGGKVIGLGVLCNRGGITPANLADVPKLFALANVSLESWAPDECPLCDKGIPINTDVGKGAEYLAKKKTEV